MKVKTKIIDKNCPTPDLKYAHSGDAGIDLTATSKFYDEFGCTCYGTNRAFEIPDGYLGLIFPRSSLCKKDLLLTNHVGILDSGYRGEVFFKFKSLNSINEGSYNIGDRVGQLIIIPYPTIEFEQVDELPETNRNDGGFGSTGV